jgi:GTP-binding protein YchF
MNLKIGIVGLPNVGKSTLFNALTRSKKASAENFPFCTIDPNVGIVTVPDSRLKELSKIVSPERIQPSIVEFVDIAGLVAGAASGEGLGNKFLHHIRECHAIAHVLRDFIDSDIHHVAGNVDPASDFEVIRTELILADLESVNKQIAKVGKKAKAGEKEAKIELALLERAKDLLEDEKPVSGILNECSEEEERLFNRFCFLTGKKFFIIANVAENDFANFDIEKFRKKIGAEQGTPIVPICAKLEADLAELGEEEAIEFLNEIGATKSGLENLIRGSFSLLNLQSYFTAGVKEVRSWTIKVGATAPEAAGAIHGDFEKGFIKADTIAFDDFIKYGGEANAKEAGKLRIEGKDYVVKDGDVMHFKFNV